MCKCGEACSLQARAFDIFGAGARESERLDSLGESKPASVDDRFSGVETSIAAGVSVMLRGNWRWRGKRRKNVGKGRVGFFFACDPPSSGTVHSYRHDMPIPREISLLHTINRHCLIRPFWFRSTLAETR